MQTDITKTTTASMTGVTNFSVTPLSSDATYTLDENIYYNPNFKENYGYYRSMPELKQPIDTFFTWCLGNGYDCESKGQEIDLSYIDGSGEDTFLSIMWNHGVIKKVNGDSYCEIIRDDTGKLINLKPLNPEVMRTIYNKKGRIIRYEQWSPNGNYVKFNINQILHSMNNRVIDEPHGIDVIESCKWYLDAKHEALRDWRKILHKSSVRILYINEDDPTRLANIKSKYPEAIQKGDLLILPTMPGEAKFEDLTLPPAEQFMRWLEYIDNKIYQNLGIPKVILGGTSENTEASAKISTIVFEPPYTKEQYELEQDLWNQVGIKLKFRKQPSLMDNMQTDEAKNTGQTKLGYQGSQ